MAGLATAVVGGYLSSVGGIRKTNAEFALRKFNIAPKNSMALGVGITIRF
jgi:hypothetical protein